MCVCVCVCVGVCALTTISFTELNVTVSPDYMPAPGESPEELAANEFRAGSVLSLICMALGGSGGLTYSWSLQGNPPPPSGCGSCPTPTSSTATLTFRPALYSYYAGTYTCTVSESGRPSSGNSDSHTVTVVGECHGVCTCVCSVQ